MSQRTLKIKAPAMKGGDVSDLQREIIRIGKTWGVDFPLKVDGVYGRATRSFAKMILFGRGHTYEEMEGGITPELRVKLRNPEKRSDDEKRRSNEKWRKSFRDDLRQKFSGDEDVAAPISKILTMSWGWHPPVHDGIDLICGPNAPLYAICDAKVIDVRNCCWWGKAPSGEVSRGDGIIQLKCLTDDGPFKKGMHVGYGHAEHATVKPNQLVEAGERIGLAGLAVAWHTHMVMNHGNTMKGIGQFDPRPFIEYAIRKS